MKRKNSIPYFLSPLSAYEHCGLCPRRCGVNRLAGGRGFCGETAELRIAAAVIHRGEEPPVTGSGGSGTVFVTGCTLGCGFCQNRQISQQGMGAAADTDSFGGICMALQERGAENINIVTGGHAAPALVLGIRAARSMGLSIPVLWNSSAYEGDLSILEDTVDIYLPDLKTLDGALAGRFFKAPDYPEYAERAILRMMETRPGQVIVRHLVLPDHLDSTREALRWFAGHSRGRARLSLMTQYTPVGAHVPGRYVSQGEYETVLGWLEEFDIGEGFYQELAPGDSWLPDFRRRNPFPPALSEPVWHWRTGFIRRGFEKVEKV